MNNSFGDIYRITTFGESHGPAIGGIIDGLPAGVAINFGDLAAAMARRRPGQSSVTTQRRESDSVELLSGVFDGKSTGTPIGFIIRNSDQHSADYGRLKDVYRPSHADYTFAAKYGDDCRDYRGGGRSSARETAARVVGGELARQALAQATAISVRAFTISIGGVSIPMPAQTPSAELVDSSIVKCPDPEASAAMESAIIGCMKSGDTLGGVVACRIDGCPVGLGDPVFGKLQARLAYAMMTIGAAKGFEYGMGFDGASMRGSQVVDLFAGKGDCLTSTNHSGGIQGGISNGMPIEFKVAFKPIATMMRPLEMKDRITGRNVTVEPRGRHDVCAVPRAVAVVEAMTWITLLDCMLKMGACQNLKNFNN